MKNNLDISWVRIRVVVRRPLRKHTQYRCQWRVHCQVTVSEVNRVMGTPGVPVLGLLRSALSTGHGDVLRRMRQLPAAKILRHSETAVGWGPWIWD